MKETREIQEEKRENVMDDVIFFRSQFLVFLSVLTSFYKAYFTHFS